MTKTDREKKAYYHQYYRDHKEERSAYQKKRKKKRKKRTIKAQAYIRRRRRIEDMEISLTVTQWGAILEMFDYRCVYCGRTESELADEGGLQQDHWVPVVRKGAYTRFNVVPSCRTCNMQKGTKTPSKFLAKMGRVEEVTEVTVAKQPCPFCGSYVVSTRRGGRYLYWCVCVKCKADGPPAATAVAAVERWDERGDGSNEESVTGEEGEASS